MTAPQPLAPPDDHVPADASVASGTLGAAFARAVGVGSGFVINISLARGLGPAGRGTYAALLLVSQVGALLGSVGMENAAASLAGQSRAAGVALRHTIRRTMVGAIAAAAVAVVGVALFGAPGTLPRVPLLVALAAVPLVAGTLLYGGLVRGLGQLRTFNRGVACESASLAGGLALLALAGRLSLITALGWWALVQLTKVGYYATRTARVLQGAAETGRAPHRAVVFGLQAWFSQLVGTLNARLDYWILGSLAGAAELGQYATAVALAELLMLVPAALATALLPPMATLARPDAWRLARRGVRLAVLTALVMGLGLALVGPIAIGPVFGERFLPAIPPLLILLPGYVLWSLVHVTTVYFLGAAREPKTNSLVALTALLVDLPGVLVLGRLYGARGAAAASSAAYIVGALFALWLFRRAWRGDSTPPQDSLGDDLRFVWARLRTLTA